MERLYTAAMFHDIGKAAHSAGNSSTNRGGLTWTNRALIETIPWPVTKAAERQRGPLARGLDAWRLPHEYLDGSGYPMRCPDTAVSDNRSAAHHLRYLLVH